MSELPGIVIDHSQRFEHLARAPIVEAVIDFRSRVEAPWEEVDITDRLRQVLPDFPTFRRMAGVSLSAHFQLGQVAAGAHGTGSATRQEHGWFGVRAESGDGRLIALFTRDGFSLSKLAPYEEWARFRTEALRLWEIYASLAAPTAVQRFGVRYINRFLVPAADLEFSEYFNGLGAPPGGLPTGSFLYQDALTVPGYPYVVNVVRTFQPPKSQNDPAVSLLLDIDARDSEPTPPEKSTIERRLADLHWLKNRVFFSTMTERALDLCR
jgi:uncharacterized protein (TIGR04255 family)